MSKDLQALSGGALSADILAKIQSYADEERDRVGSSGGGDMISINNGKRVFTLPNGNETEQFEGFIVDFAYRNEYYMGAYNPKNIQPPACFAIAGSESELTPSDNSPVKQNDGDCSTCQHNQFGSHPSGGGKACKNTVILAVLPAADYAESDIWVLKTSPTAIRPFNEFARKVGNMGLSLGIVRTRFFFDPDSAYASVRFEAMGIEVDDMDTLFGRKEEGTRRLQQEPDVSQFEMPVASK